MQITPEIQQAISKAVKKNGQSPQFELRFRKFFENLITGNYRHSDLEELISAVHIEGDDEEES